MWRWRAGALALFTTLAVVIVLNIDTLRALKIRRFLLYDEDYSAFGYDQFWAGGIRLGLSLRVVRRVFKPLVEPRARWLFRSHHATQTGTKVLPPVEPK